MRAPAERRCEFALLRIVGASSGSSQQFLNGPCQCSESGAGASSGQRQPLAPGRSSLALPSPLRALLPIGHLQPLPFSVLPSAARCRERIRIVAVEQQNHPIVARHVGGRRHAIDQEPHTGAIRIAVPAASARSAAPLRRSLARCRAAESYPRGKSKDARRVPRPVPANPPAQRRATRVRATSPAMAEARAPAAGAADDRNRAPSSRSAAVSARNFPPPARRVGERPSPSPSSC